MLSTAGSASVLVYVLPDFLYSEDFFTIEVIMMRWEFTPYNIEKWNKSNERLLFVAAEPNGEQPNGGYYDMGAWFRTAKPENKYYNNKQFFARCEIILSGLSNDMAKNIFDNFRLMDLKATSGTEKSNRNVVEDYVNNNFDEVIKYFNSTEEDFGLFPHIVVLLGDTAQSVFKRCIKEKLTSNPNLKFVGMPHPSHTVAYDALTKASRNIRQHLNPITSKTTDKWIYCKDDHDVWRKI